MATKTLKIAMGGTPIADVATVSALDEQLE